MIEKTITPGRILLSSAICLMLLSAGTVFTSCKSEPKVEDTKEVAEDQNEAKFDENDAKEDDTEILVAAAEFNMMEIEIGKLAKAKSTSPSVKKHADMLITDHTKALDELKAYAEKTNVSLPMSLTDKGKEELEDLNKKTGTDFDKKFAELMNDSHDDAIAKMEKAATDANSPDVKAWAAGMLPTLKSHKEHATMLKDQVK